MTETEVIAVTGGVAAIVAIAALGVSLWAYFVTRDHLLLERVHRINDRLYEFDRATIDYPEVQCFLYLEAKRKDPYFDPAVVHNEMYFRVKAFIYARLNHWDEIFTVVEGNKRLEEKVAFDSWKTYIIEKMRHPRYKELFRLESRIWGKKFQDFIAENKQEIDKPVDPEMF